MLGSRRSTRNIESLKFVCFEFKQFVNIVLDFIFYLLSVRFFVILVDTQYIDLDINIHLLFTVLIGYQMCLNRVEKVLLFTSSSKLACCVILCHGMSSFSQNRWPRQKREIKAKQEATVIIKYFLFYFSSISSYTLTQKCRYVST